MNKSSFIQEGDSAKKASNLVRRVSDMFKDGTYSGPPSLFSQKIRHCCQNLNLFPYLLYSFENSKSHPLAKKVNFCFDLILKTFIERLLFVCTSARRAAIAGLQKNSLLPSNKKPVEPKNTIERSESKSNFYIIKRQKPKQTPALLVAAIYLAPMVLLFQLIGLCSLLIFGKYTPGFIFLISSLMLLAIISMKIMFHDTIAHQRKKEERREEERREKRKEERREKRKEE